MSWERFEGRTMTSISTLAVSLGRDRITFNKFALEQIVGKCRWADLYFDRKLARIGFRLLRAPTDARSWSVNVTKGDSRQYPQAKICCSRFLHDCGVAAKVHRHALAFDLSFDPIEGLYWFSVASLLDHNHP